VSNLTFSEKLEKKVVPIRIREARISRGYSLSDLAEELNVSKQMISKYELGIVKVPIENLIEISKVLNFPISFFYNEKNRNFEKASESVTFFRSLRSTTKKTRISLIQNIEFLQEILFMLQKYISFPAVDIPEDIALDYKIGVNDKYIEEVARKLRVYWELGDGPIINLTNILLKKGFLVTRIELNTEKVDAFSKLTNSGVPIIVLGSDKESAVRSRMDLAHELGHIILHSHIEESEFEKNIKKIESEANRFAGAFLMPENTFSEDVYSASLNSLVYLKEKWKVSVAAMVVRLKSLNFIDEDQYNYLFKQINVKGWRKKEPLDDSIRFETPNIIKEAFDLLIENNVMNSSELLENITLNPVDIEKLCFLPEGYFDKKILEVNKPKLKIIK